MLSGHGRDLENLYSDQELDAPNGFGEGNMQRIA